MEMVRSWDVTPTAEATNTPRRQILMVDRQENIFDDLSGQLPGRLQPRSRRKAIRGPNLRRIDRLQHSLSGEFR
jgi:hypothetical protein